MKVRLPPTFRQLCVITREQVEAEPTIDDFEWRERIKQRLIDLGFTYPTDREAISRAMTQVEKALENRWGPRPVPQMDSQRRLTAPSSPQRDPPWGPYSREHSGWSSLRELIADLATRLRR